MSMRGVASCEMYSFADLQTKKSLKNTDVVITNMAGKPIDINKTFIQLLNSTNVKQKEVILSVKNTNIE